ncbi:MAG: TetR/AcrR family transcriptional regulator [Actinomycetota bacterium]|nr:TetR/AcrR family transcriptional regulator [Actinomycetota bacterium]
MPPAKTRDAERSRAQILQSAERVFAHEGYDAASLAMIGDAAGVSRATPSYFFGSKQELYQAVLRAMYRDRTATLQPAFAPVAAWAESEAPAETLRTVLGRAVASYLSFLSHRPTYVDIIEREALARGQRLNGLQVESTVMEDAFAALRRHARRHGLGSFDVGEAVICLVALGYTPVAHRHTLLRRHGFVHDDPRFLARRRRHIVDLLLHMMVAP